MMEVPQLHGFGPAANRLLEAYNTLLKVFLKPFGLFYANFAFGCFDVYENICHSLVAVSWELKKSTGFSCSHGKWNRANNGPTFFLRLTDNHRV